jgi:hypothetical protein
LKDIGLPIPDGVITAVQWLQDFAHWLERIAPGYTREEVDVSVNNMKTAMDAGNQVMTKENLRLQGLTEKQSQTVDLLTNLMAKDAKISNAILSNTR